MAKLPEVGDTNVWPLGFVTRVIEQEMDPGLLSHSWTIIARLEDDGTSLFVLKLCVLDKYRYRKYLEHECVETYEILVGETQLAQAIKKILDHKRGSLIRASVERVAELEARLNKA